uniref:Uncharacterized protein n=1 Tax=Coccolithus braarudii TaxID=221442 RepID=A0A7S0QBA4_9EUKA|mmetsp:Transcript_6986/g.15313  ORF Transcript_6986/g.15313 Transcript_6986/m.15313 type:complete len:197 (+) Transcript_6986:25-615(+)|eukprot:CAMPEP_0183355068 /NCGR_PEP_ID=MMETSP0164_2-20130417/39080_1 /TAXON_ID=221442 /ORGANISM="Coccolithus pelagicus ssp braarudi, Strain PLY182g" /LENGTH=196 /DNA_ID=CAMNT_0025528083 /DNA_START=20 /DNA_END=610 /DNA_ORIENTATION=+
MEFVETAKQFIGTQYNAAKARAGQALAAKALLDEGGPAQERKVVAKSDAASAVTSHAGLVAQLTDVISQYEAAAKKLGDTEGPMGEILSAEEKAEFVALSAEYEAMARMLKAVQLGFPGADEVGVPTSSPIEDDAATILYLSHRVQDAKQRAVAVATQAMDDFNQRRGKTTPGGAHAAQASELKLENEVSELKHDE